MSTNKHRRKAEKLVSQEVVGQPEIYRCLLVSHDYLFFTTMGLRYTAPSKYIGNYALMYALNRHIQAVQRNAAGTVPHYNTDLRLVTLYATPAKPSTSRTVSVAHNTLSWENKPPVYFTYNSIQTVTQTTETDRTNFPLVGKKGKYPPLNSFEFYVIGGSPSGIVRLGKKQVACRVYAEKLTVVGSEVGLFEPDHPVNPSDLGLRAADIVSGQIVWQTPPLIVGAKIKARYYVCIDDENRRHKIARPDPDKYLNVKL